MEAGSSPVTDLAQLAARLQRLEDAQAIKRLIVRYAQGADRGNDVDVMLPLFTEDAVWDGGERFGVHAGKPAIREFLSQSGAFIGWTLHYMVSPDVVVARDGQTATAFWYLWETANMPDRVSGRAEAFWIGGTYDGEAVKLADGSWRFSRLALNLKLLSPYRKGWAEKRLPD